MSPKSTTPSPSTSPGHAASTTTARSTSQPHTDRHTFRLALTPPGLGLALTTYQGDGSPLPPFQGEPLWLPLVGDADQVLETCWEALDPENRVSLAVKEIPAGGGSGQIRLRNQHV